MLHTLKPHRHKQEQSGKKRPKRNKLTWIRVFTCLDKHTLRLFCRRNLWIAWFKLHPEHYLDDVLVFSLVLDDLAVPHIYEYMTLIGTFISNFKCFVFSHQAKLLHTLCPINTFQTVQRTEMESATYTLRLQAENSTAWQLGSASDTTAQSTRTEAMTNMGGFPQSRRSFKFSKREADTQWQRVPPWVTEHQTPFKLHMENVCP